MKLNIKARKNEIFLIITFTYTYDFYSRMIEELKHQINLRGIDDESEFDIVDYSISVSPDEVKNGVATISYETYNSTDSVNS